MVYTRSHVALSDNQEMRSARVRAGEAAISRKYSIPLREPGGLSFRSPPLVGMDSMYAAVAEVLPIGIDIDGIVDSLHSSPMTTDIVDLTRRLCSDVVAAIDREWKRRCGPASARDNGVRGAAPRIVMISADAASRGRE